MIDMPLMSNNILREDVDSLINFLKTSNRFTQGGKVKEFETAWGKWLGVNHVLFVNSGSSANYITMHTLAEIYGKGEVIVSPIGWSSTVAAVINAGLKPVFVDVDFNTLSMNEEKILNAITSKTKAIFLTHVLGFNAITNRLMDALHNLHRGGVLLEDCCESHGATYNGKKIGTFGKASNFSFYYAHHMSTIEGGVICTDDEDFYQYARMFRSHGMVRECNETYRKKFISTETYPEFTFPVAGFNMRSTELNAVIGLSQIKRLDANNEKRKENFKIYLEHLDSNRYFTDFKTDGSVNYALILLIKASNKNLYEKVVKMLNEEKVEFRRGTAGGGNLARQKFVKKAFPDISSKELVNAEYIHEFGLYFGNYPDLEKNKIIELCEKLNSL